MTCIRSARLTLVACLVGTPAMAQSEIPRVSDLLMRGQTIEVIDDHGRETKGKVDVVSTTSVSLVENGRRTEVPLAAITQIARPSDGLGNGALIGFGAGAIVGFLASTVGTESAEGCELTFGPCEGPRLTTAATLAFGAMGTGLGVLVDALIRHDRVIYRRASRPLARVAPLVTPNLRGAIVSISW